MTKLVLTFSRTMLAVWLTLPAVIPCSAQTVAMQQRQPITLPSLTGPGELLSRPAGLDVNRVPIAAALLELQARAGVPMIFSPSALGSDRQVSCKCETQTVREALARLLRGTAFVFSEQGGSILIEPAAVSASSAQTRIVTGRVTDSLTSEPVTGGQVSVQGSAIGSSVKDDGTFTIAVPSRDVTLVVRSIGFKRRDVTVPNNQNSVQVRLERDYFQLEAIVVTGQATGVERRNLANAVSTVTADQLVKTATSTVDQALVGKLAGVQITSNHGAPGGGMQIKLRGMNSVLGSSVPLWVVDGVIINNQEIGSGLNYITQGGSQACNASGSVCGAQDQVVNRASDLNPNDIQSVEVLKGAAASAIYGSKANNGVILITTKRGRVGTPQFSLTQRVGVSSILRRVGPFRQFTSAAEAATAYGPAALADWVPTYYDHEMELFGRKPVSYETSASVNGGTETTRYFLSGLVKRDGGINTRTWADKQSLRLNLDQTIGSRLSFGVSTSVLHTGRAPGFNNNDNNEVGLYYALMVTPTWIDLRQVCPDGSRAPGGKTCAGGVWPIMPYGNSNALETASMGEAVENVWRTINSAKMDFTAINTPTHTLKFLGNGGIDFFSKRDFVFTAATLQFEPRVRPTNPGTVVHSASFVNQMNVTGSLVHTLKPASGALTATTSIGATYEQRSFNFSQILGNGLISGVADVDETTVQRLQQTRYRIRDRGYFAQEEVLLLHEKLLLTAGIRADQSSTNADAKKLFYYPKFAASYRMNLIRGLLDEVKVRAAYGQSGNQPQYGDKFNALTTGNYGGLARISIGTVLVAPLQPERQAEIETGVDATVLGGRANVELTVYQRTIRDLLINRALVPSTGFVTARFNGATFRTRGLEAALSVVPIQSSKLQWQFRTTFSTDNTVITFLPVPPFIAAGTYSRGAARFTQDSSATDVWGNDTLPDGTPLAQKIGNINPDFTMGLTNDFKWKSVGFNFLLNWQQGGLVANLTNADLDAARVTKDYTDPCVGNCLPGETLGGQRSRLGRAFHTRIYAQDATYLKLREATITVDLPRSFVNKFWSASRYMRLALSGRNLLVFTPYAGVDPEVNNGGTQNIRIGFEDIAPYPPARSFWFSLDVGF